MKQTRRIILTTIFCTIIIEWLAPLHSLADTVQNRQELGDWFYQQGEYYRAITEYETARFLDGKAGGRDDGGLSLKVARSYYAGKQYASAVTYIERLVSSEKISVLQKNRLMLIRVKSWMRQDDYTQALTGLQDIRPGDLPPPERDQLPLIGAYALIYSEKADQARAALAQIPAANAYHPVAQKISARLDAGPPQMKSPLVAGALSIVPGLGQLVHGYYGEAILSFLVNGVIGYFAWDAYRRGREIPHYGYVPLAGWALIQLPFYGGNIYNAARLVKQSNDRAYRDYYNELGSYGYERVLGAE